MKRTLKSVLLVLVISLLFSLVSLADTVKFEDDYVQEDDVVFAALNGVQSFLADLRNTEPLDEACFWLADFADKLNLKYVSFNGRMSSGANYTYSNIVSNKKGTQSEMLAMNNTDQVWIDEFLTLKKFGESMTREGLPYGVSIHINDYYANAFNRSNHIANHFIADDFTGYDADVIIEAYNSNNFAMTVNNNGTKYVVYQLEAMPQKAVLDWFNKTNANHMDKRAFVFTFSFATAKGEMYTAYDPTVSGYTASKNKGNSILNTNMVNYGTPYDGNQLWNYYLSKHDNIVMIMSANATPGTEIVTSKFENANGYEVVSVVTNLMKGYDAMGAYPVLIKFNEEKKTLDLRYAVPYFEMEGGYIEESVVTIELGDLVPLEEPDPLALMPKVATQYNGENKKYINGYAGNLFKPNANMTRAEASTIFARLLTGSTTLPTGNTTRFADVKAGDWYYDAIAYMDTNNFYMSNKTDSYRPNDPITRAEFVELAYLASKLAATKTVKFKDVSEDHQYYDAIIAAAASGLVNGYEDSTFRPDGKITRAEVVTIINRMLSLVCNAETVDKTHLTNVFSDITGHWAENQILMSANDNVHGANFYNIDASIYTENASTISFESGLVKISMSKKNGKITDVVYKPTGESVLGTSATPWFSYVTTKSGAKLSPSKIELIDGRLKFTYRGGYVAYFIIEVYDDFFSAQLDSNISKELARISFGGIPYSYVAKADSGFRASAVAMDTRATLSCTPGGYKSTAPYVYALTTINVDIMGAKAGFAFNTYDTHRDALKHIIDNIDPAKGVKNLKQGPYALDNPDIFGDYLIMHNLNPNNVDDYGALCQKYDIEILDLHFGTTFTTGDFNFIAARTPEEIENKTFIDGKTYKERVVDKLNSYGVDIAIHSYAQGVDDDATGILTNPKWQKDLFIANTYTLRGDVSAFRTTFKTYEDASNYKVDSSPMPYSSTYGTSHYLIVDEEIIKVTQSKGTTSGFMQVQRGQLGTKAVAHKDGAEIRHLACWYGVFHPIPGSELFYYIADQHAKAYNESGATMIYLDCIDVIATKLCTGSEMYYYESEFIRRIISQCDTYPMIESANNGDWMWNSAGRKGAIDSYHQGFKKGKKGHFDTYGTDADRTYLSATMGWFSFDTDTGTRYHNTFSKTLFHDDLDYLGSLCLAANYSMVPNSFSPASDKNVTTRLPDNYAYYGVYSRLRKANYFAPEVKDAVRKGKYEYRLMQLDDGSYAFREMKYVDHKIHFSDTAADRTGSGTNPFSAHTPFIRIEQRFSTLGEDEVLVLALDETKAISSVTGTKTITAKNLSNTRAFKIKVLGNSQDGGILISVQASTGSARNDYFISTNFEGWREFTLIDTDNADHPFTFSQAPTGFGNYGSTYGGSISFSSVAKITIGVAGTTTGVRIDDLRAVKMVDAPAKNPSVTIGSSTITFNTEVESGEFIEFYPDTGKAYLNYYDEVYDAETGAWKSYVAHVKEITYTGSVTVPAGNFSFEYNAESVTGAPLRAKVKIGLQGNIIKNPADWVAPEVDMGVSSLDIVLR